MKRINSMLLVMSLIFISILIFMGLMLFENSVDVNKYTKLYFILLTIEIVITPGGMAGILCVEMYRKIEKLEEKIDKIEKLTKSNSSLKDSQI